MRTFNMPDLKAEEIQRYLEGVLHRSVTVSRMVVLGSESATHEVKGYGYGVPLRVDFQVDGACRTAVFHTMSPSPFGHEHMSDRAQQLLWDHCAFNHLPNHVRSLDVCGIQPDGRLISIGKAEEFCLLTEYAEGESYSHDLSRIRDTGAPAAVDLTRADASCDYLSRDPQEARQ